MNAFIHFYINQANQTISLPSFVSDFKDISTIDYEAKKIPLNFSKYLPGSSERKITLSIDVFGENYEQARNNFKNLSTLNRLMFLLKDEQTGNPRKTAILNVLYQNLIIRPNQNPAGNVKDVGLPCYMTTFEQAIQYESGFYTFNHYVFPKLIKVSMTLIPVLKSTGVDSPSWFVDAAGNINVNSQNYKSNWPSSIPTGAPPEPQIATAQAPSTQNNNPPKSATEAARRANVDAAASSGNIYDTKSRSETAPMTLREEINRDIMAKITGAQAKPKYTSSTESLESPHFSPTKQLAKDGNDITPEEKKYISSETDKLTLKEQINKEIWDKISKPQKNEGTKSGILGKNETSTGAFAKIQK